jgi:hypothetical protein
MRQRPSPEPLQVRVVIREGAYEQCDPAQRAAWDWLWRRLLGPRTETPPAPTALAAVPGRSNAPAAETPGASTDIGTVTSSATNKQGSIHDTTRKPS